MYSVQSQHIMEMFRNLKDLANCGHQHNFHILGIPESLDGDNLEREVVSLFKDLLNGPPESLIEMENIHRAFRTGGQGSDPLRDLACCLTSFILKEDILQWLRDQNHIHFGDAKIHFFQDLSTVLTLNSIGPLGN